MSTDKSSLVSRVVTSKSIWLALLVVAVGIIMLWASNIVWFDTRPARQATLNQLGGLLITAGGLGLLWDLRGKRDFMEEVLEKARLASDISAAGIKQVTMEWLEVPWADLFAKSAEVEVSVTYGSLWRRINLENLRKFANHPGRSLRLYLPNPDDEAVMRILALRYGDNADKIKANIIETAREFEELQANGRANIKIYYRTGDPSYVLYRFDEMYVMTLYSHMRKRGAVPVMATQGAGSFADFFKRDMEHIREQSIEKNEFNATSGENGD